MAQRHFLKINLYLPGATPSPETPLGPSSLLRLDPMSSMSRPRARQPTSSLHLPLLWVQTLSPTKYNFVYKTADKATKMKRLNFSFPLLDVLFVKKVSQKLRTCCFCFCFLARWNVTKMTLKFPSAWVRAGPVLLLGPVSPFLYSIYFKKLVITNYKFFFFNFFFFFYDLNLFFKSLLPVLQLRTIFLKDQEPYCWNVMNRVDSPIFQFLSVFSVEMQEPNFSENNLLQTVKLPPIMKVR